MNEIEKLRLLLPHWQAHNQEHAGEFHTWAERARALGEAHLAAHIEAGGHHGNAKQLGFSHHSTARSSIKIVFIGAYHDQASSRATRPCRRQKSASTSISVSEMPYGCAA